MQTRDRLTGTHTLTYKTEILNNDARSDSVKSDVLLYRETIESDILSTRAD